VTKSAIIRDSLEKSLHEPQSAGELSCYGPARDLAGSVRGLPKDLADTPKYMDDFGQ
jgi:hypothetical protein